MSPHRDSSTKKRVRSHYYAILHHMSLNILYHHSWQHSGEVACQAINSEVGQVGIALESWSQKQFRVINATW